MIALAEKHFKPSSTSAVDKLFQPPSSSASSRNYATLTQQQKVIAMYDFFAQSSTFDALFATRAIKPALAAMAGDSDNSKLMREKVIDCLASREPTGHVPILGEHEHAAELMVRCGIIARDPTPTAKFAFSSGLMIDAMANHAFGRAKHRPTDIGQFVEQCVQSMPRSAFEASLDAVDSDQWKEAVFAATLRTYNSRTMCFFHSL